MEEFASLWNYQENMDDFKQKFLDTTLELERVKAETQEEMIRNHESMKKLLQELKDVCHERDEAKDQLQKLQTKLMATNDQQIFNDTSPLIPNSFANDQIQQYHQGPFMIPVKTNSCITESNSLSEAYNHTPSPIDSFFDSISSPEFSNLNVETPFVQDYHQNEVFPNGLNGLANEPKVDQATLVMEEMIKGKTLPQKGKLMQAVSEAGPLLQNLLVAGPLPRWRNPPPLHGFHIPSMVAAADQIVAAPKQANKFLKSPMMLLKQNQPYAEMGCGSSSQMMVGSGAGGSGCGGVLSFGDVNFQGRMMTTAYLGATNFGTIGKRQRLL